jgi:hypothetical protein
MLLICTRNETERPLGGGGAGYGEVATYVDRVVDILNLAAVAIIAKVRTLQEQERKKKLRQRFHRRVLGLGLGLVLAGIGAGIG